MQAGAQPVEQRRGRVADSADRNGLAASTSTRIDAPSLVHLAADAIRKMVLSGELAPGERLIEERLTEELGISRPPLREALRLLQQDGLIETRPRRGSVVPR